MIEWRDLILGGRKARHGRKAKVSDRRGVRDKDFDVQGRENSDPEHERSARSLNRCEPSIPARGVKNGHVEHRR